MGNYSLQQRRRAHIYTLRHAQKQRWSRGCTAYTSLQRAVWLPPSLFVMSNKKNKNFTEKLSISIAGSDFQHTHPSSLRLAAVSSSQPVFASLYILWLIEVAGLCSDDKSPHSDSFTAPKEPLDKRQGCKPNILMLRVIVMACVYVCTSEYLGDVKNCLSLPIRKVL